MATSWPVGSSGSGLERQVQPVHEPEPDVLAEDPELAPIARTLRDSGHDWAWVCNAGGNDVYLTPELLRSFGGGQLVDTSIGAYEFGPEALAMAPTNRFGANTVSDTALRDAPDVGVSGT